MISGPIVGPEDEQLMSGTALRQAALKEDHVNTRSVKAGTDVGFLYPGMMLDQMRNNHAHRPIFAESAGNDEGLANYEDPGELGRRQVHPTYWDNSPVEWGQDQSVFGVPNVGVTPSTTGLNFDVVFTENMEDLTHAQLRAAMESSAGDGMDYSSYLNAVGHSLKDLATPAEKDPNDLQFRMNQLARGAEAAPSTWQLQRNFEREADLLSQRARAVVAKQANENAMRDAQPYYGEDNVHEAYEYEQGRIAGAHHNVQQSGLTSLYGEKHAHMY